MRVGELTPPLISRETGAGVPGSPSDATRAAAAGKAHQSESGDVLNLQTSSVLTEILSGYDLRNITPRQTQELAKKLYEAGVLDANEYALLAFQPEVDNPETYREITGLEPQPDQPSDLIAKYRTLLKKQQESGAHRDTTDLTRQLVQMLSNLTALSAAA
jgi:hypothetical protein